MNSIFEQIWNGNITPYQTCGANNPEIISLLALLEQNKLSMSQSLNTTQNETFKNYIACYDELHYLMCVHAYQDGFSLAYKLLRDAQ